MGFIIRQTQRLAIGLIRLYQLIISPYANAIPRCRFYPTCSDYAISALRHYGTFKGIFFAVARIVRCHPWSSGGYDPVLPCNEVNIKNSTTEKK